MEKNWRKIFSCDSGDIIIFTNIIGILGKVFNRILLILFGHTILIRELQRPFLMKYLDLDRSDSVMDIGCSSGVFTKQIAKKKVNFTVGLDIRPIKNHQMNNINLFWLQGACEHLPFKENLFNKILLSSVLQMVPDPDLVLRETHRVLDKNGILVFTVPVAYRHLERRVNFPEIELYTKIDRYWEGMNGKGRFTINELIDLINGNRFTLVSMEYAPKKLGSFVVEYLMLYRLQRNKKYLIHSLDFLLYPILFFDRFLSKKSIGFDVICLVKPNQE